VIELRSALFMDRLGGKKLLALSLIFAGACAAGFAYVNASTEVTTSTAIAIVALAGGFNAFTTAGWNAIDLMSTESFPTDVRTTGMGLLASGGRSASVIAQFVNGYLIGPPPHVTTLLVITASMMLIGSISALFVRDYSNKELPESVEDMRREAEEEKLGVKRVTIQLM
jgi:MFS family permease